MEQEKVHSSFWSSIFKSTSQKNDLKDFLTKVPLFQHLNNKDILLLLSYVHHRSFLSGESIFNQGDPGVGIYLIINGEVKIERTSLDGRSIKLADLHKGDFFGELALIDNEKRSASAIATSDLDVAVIFKPDLDEFVSKYPKKGLVILKNLNLLISQKLRNVNEENFNFYTEVTNGTKNK